MTSTCSPLDRRVLRNGGASSSRKRSGIERERELQAMGAAATQIEPAQAVAGAGLYRVAMALGWGGAQTLFFQNAILTAGTGTLLVLCVGAMRFSSGVGLAVGLLFGLGTFAWPYATTYFRDPLVMFGSALAFLGWVRITRPGGLAGPGGWLVLAAGVMIAVMAKNAGLVLLPAVGLMVPTVVKRAARPVNRRWVIWAAGLLLLAILLLLIPKPEPLARYTLGYYTSLARHFFGSLDVATLVSGTLGPFLSPARSLFLFCPPLFLVVAVPRRWWREEPAVAGAVLLTATGMALAQVLFYRQQWAGAVGWGPRPMLPVLPGLMLLTAPAVERLWVEARGRWAIFMVAAASGVVQLSAVLVPWQAAFESIRTLGLEPYTYTGAWDIRRLLPLHQLPALLRLDVWETVWTRLARASSQTWIVPVVLCAFGVICGGVLLRLRRDRAWMTILLAPLLSLALLWGTGNSLGDDPAWFADLAELGDAIQLVEAEARVGDAVVIDAYATPIWFRMMNEWSHPRPMDSLPFEIPGMDGRTSPHPDVRPIAGETCSPATDGSGCWPPSAAPDYLDDDERTWLAQHSRLVSERSFEGSTRADVLVFESGRP